MALTKYPLDLSGHHPDNRVAKEPHQIGSPAEVILVLNHGPFFATSVSIEEGAQRRLLEPENDFTFNYLHEEASQRSGKPVYGLIILKDKDFKGELLITYQVVGGEYADYAAAIDQALEDLLSTDGTVSWEAILNKPMLYPPAPHQHTMDDLTGVEGIVQALNDIAGAIGGNKPSDMTAIYEALRQMVSNTGHCKRSPLPDCWLLTPDHPLRLKLTGYPGSFTVLLDVFDTSKGASLVWLSGRLSLDGAWSFRHYYVLYGQRPELSCYLYNRDAISADVLIQSHAGHQQTIWLHSVVYYEIVPSNFQAEMLLLEENFRPDDSHFVALDYPWGSGSELDNDKLDRLQQDLADLRLQVDNLAQVEGNYYPASGGPLTGNLSFDSAYHIEWQRDFSTAQVAFQANSDDDTKSSLCFQVSGDLQENFVWKMTTQEETVNELMHLYNNHLFLSGDFHCQGDVVANFSDSRLKENIVPVQNALAIVANWQAVRFNPNAEAEALGDYNRQSQEIGLIAQDVREDVPEAVCLAPFDRKTDRNEEGSRSGENYLTIKYYKLIPHLVQAIKELNAKVEALSGDRIDVRSE